MVLTTPALRAIRKSFVHAQLTLMVSPGTVDLVKDHPYIDDLLIDDRAGEFKGTLGFLQLCRRIRSYQFDLVIVFHSKTRYHLACFLAGIPLRLGYKSDKWGLLLNKTVPDTRMLGVKHEAQYCLDLVKTIGVEEDGLALCVTHQEQAELWAAQWIETHVPKGFQLMVIHPSASDLTRLWPAEYFAELIDKINKRYLVKIVLIGQGHAGDIATAISSHVKSSVINLTNQCSLAQTCSLIARSNLVVSHDSGPVHLAVALEIPTVCIFLRNQPGINPTRWRPLGVNSITVTPNDNAAIKVNHKSEKISGEATAISVDMVITAIDDVMARQSQFILQW